MSQKNTVKKQTGFNWWAFFAAGPYFAGKGQLGKGLLMGCMSSHPLLLLIVGIYGGFSAKELQSIKSFSWGKAFIIVVVQVVAWNAIQNFITGYRGDL